MWDCHRSWLTSTGYGTRRQWWTMKHSHLSKWRQTQCDVLTPRLPNACTKVRTLPATPLSIAISFGCHCQSQQPLLWEACAPKEGFDIQEACLHPSHHGLWRGCYAMLLSSFSVRCKHRHGDRGEGAYRWEGMLVLDFCNSKTLSGAQLQGIEVYL
jgi:hypothetical protein